jgi:hypothetical protein
VKISKIAYKPVGLALGATSGMIAGAAFKQAWKLAGHDDDAPDATDEERSWQEILLAAALQGAIFAVRYEFLSPGDHADKSPTGSVTVWFPSNPRDRG